MIAKIWTEDQVRSLNEFQKSGVFHPFTCGGNRTDANHLDGEGVLVATQEGWVCPYCDYRQTWCYPWMIDWTWKKAKSWGDVPPLGGTE